MIRHASNIGNELRQNSIEHIDRFDSATPAPAQIDNQNDKSAAEDTAFLSLAQYTQEELSEYREVFCMFDKVCAKLKAS